MANAVRDSNYVTTIMGVDEATGTTPTNIKVTPNGEVLVNDGGTSELLMKIDEADASTTYVGEASIGTATSASTWKIKKISVSSTITTIGWAGGVATYTKVWDDRASYVYS
jgi:hypothetical protein